MDAQPGPLDAPSAPTVGSLWSDVSGLELEDELLQWPADVFALAGTILRRTHAYRFAVSPPAGRHWPPRPHWNDVVSDAAEHWCGWVDEPQGEAPTLLTDAWALLCKESGTPVDDVRQGSHWPLVEALLTLLSVSDEGRRRLDDVADHRRKLLDERLGDWDDDELAGFAELLARYNATLEARPTS